MYLLFTCDPKCHRQLKGVSKVYFILLLRSWQSTPKQKHIWKDQLLKCWLMQHDLWSKVLWRKESNNTQLTLLPTWSDKCISRWKAMRIFPFIFVIRWKVWWKVLSFVTSAVIVSAHTDTFKPKPHYTRSQEISWINRKSFLLFNLRKFPSRKLKKKNLRDSYFFKGSQDLSKQTQKSCKGVKWNVALQHMLYLWMSTNAANPFL